MKEGQQERLPKEMINILKSQDIGYVRTKHNAERKVRLAVPFGGPFCCVGFMHNLIDLLPPQLLHAQKIERLQATLHGTTAAPANRHTVFVDEPEQVEKFDALEYFDSTAESVKHPQLRPRKRQRPLEVDEEIEEESRTKRSAPALPIPASQKKLTRLRKRAYEELEQRKARADNLGKVIQHFEAQKNIMVRVETLCCRKCPFRL